MFLEVFVKNSSLTAVSSRIQNELLLIQPTKTNFLNKTYATVFEEHKKIKFRSAGWSYRKFWNFFCWFFFLKYRSNTDIRPKTHTAQLLFWDMLSLYKAWRHLKGYPVNGQRTWSNGVSCTKNNQKLKQHRLLQFKQVFGAKRKLNYVTLIQCEAMNKLWLKTWPAEWLQAHIHAIKSKSRKSPTIPIDIANLAKGVTTGYLRRGEAEKWNKSKKALKTVTIGLPLYFSRFFFSQSKLKKFKFLLIPLQSEEKKKIQKKKQKNKKVKKKTVKKK